MPIDNRTPNLSLPLPHPDNFLGDDVLRVRDAFGAIDASIHQNDVDLSEHAGNTLNPHGVTKSQVGLGSCDNTSDANKPVSSATQTALNAKIDLDQKGSANGVATLDASSKVPAAQLPAMDYVPTSSVGAASGVASLDSGGKVPAAQLPSYVDDVLEYANQAAFPGTGETGKIYIALDNNKSFRWSGSAYVEIVASPGSTDLVTEGSTNLYFTYQRVRNTVLTGLSTATNAVIAAADSVLVALGKLQAQITANLSTLTSHTGNSSNPHSTTAAQVGAMSTSHAANLIAGLGGSGTATTVSRSDHNHSGVYQPYDADLDAWAGITPSSKQATLVSGTNIKTVNGISLLGSGDIDIPTGVLPGVAVTTTGTSTINTTELYEASSAITRTIPAGTSVGARIAYKDNGQLFADNNLTITPPSGHRIEDFAVDESLVVSKSYLSFELRQVAPGIWRIF